ncbi:tyrosine-type recombinase/integrase [Shewanella sediminis]|uniref:tyrosine-type recombinase/integrase n=1 Tax=Shewanella sediminis TaxID=271097 RepID=UPI0002FA919B|nr:tyrosine-type recombinase/integrase [Shewanella sediminis]
MRGLPPLTKELCRHPIHASVISRSLQKAAVKTEIRKKVNCHTFRHFFETHLLEQDNDIRTVQELLGRTILLTMSKRLRYTPMDLTNIMRGQLVQQFLLDVFLIIND